jgi:hypothetical protein
MMSATAQMRRAAEQAAGAPPGDDAYAIVWAEHWEHVQLSSLVAAEHEVLCKAAISSLVAESHQQPAIALVDLYIHYASVRGAPKECSLVLRRGQWLAACEHFGEYSEPTLAARVFESVNELREMRVRATKAQLLHAGTGLLHAQALTACTEASLKQSQFSLSEFVEGVIRLACAPSTGIESPLRRLKTRAQRAGSLHASPAASARSQHAIAMPLEVEQTVREVARILSEVIVPLARHLRLLGCDAMRADVASSPPLRQMLVSLAPMHARLYEHHSRGRRGVSLGSFIDAVATAAAGVSRSQLAHAFVQTLPLEHVLSSRQSASPVLTAAGFQQALLRVAMLRLAQSTLSDQPVGGLLPSQMAAPQLADLRSILVSIQSIAEADLANAAHRSAASPAGTLTPETSAVLTIQKCHRGRAGRKPRR